MYRFALTLIIFHLGLGGVLHAQEIVPQLPRKLMVKATGVDTLATRYRLLPADIELKDDNAAVILLRMPYERTSHMQEVVPKYRELLELPYDSPDLAEKIQFGSFYRDLHRAAHCSYAAWEYPLDEVPAAAILLPDLGAGRELVSRGLTLWIRSKIAAGDNNGAREAIAVGLANSRHYARTPALMNQLVAAAMANNMLDELERLIGQPETPNLYWAIAMIPRPFLELRPVYNWESQVLRRSVSELVKGEPPTGDATGWSVIAKDLVHMLQLFEGVATSDQLADSWKAFVVHARSEWPALANLSKESIEVMSDDEVGVRAYLWYNQQYASRIESATALPLPQAISMLRVIEHELQVWSQKWPNLSSCGVTAEPLQIHLKLHQVDRRLAALANIEAIRDYTSGHDGKLPGELEILDRLPAVPDPFTGRPFEYRVDGDRCTLTAPAILAEGTQKFELNYEITLSGK